MRSIAILAVLLSAPVAGGSAAQVAPPAGAHAARSVAGLVREAGSGNPVEGAVVTVESTVRRGSAVTGPAGDYRIRLEGDGPLRMSVERIGYEPVRIELLELQPGLAVDFALAPRPVVLAPITVNATAGAGSTGQGRLAEASFRSGPEASAVARHGIASYLAFALQAVAPRPPDTGPGPPPAGSGTGNAIRVRGSMDRLGAIFQDGAPALIAGAASFLDHPFPSSDIEIRQWDSGAPARVSGGVEYVTEVETTPGAAPSGASWTGHVDLVRSGSSFSWRGQGIAFDAVGETTAPWASRVVGEGGHASRRARLKGWLAPGPSHRVVAALTLRDEALPSGPIEGSPRTKLTEVTGSASWHAGLGNGVLATRLGIGHALTTLPSHGGLPADIGSTRARLGIWYRRPLGASLDLTTGADRLELRWNPDVAAGVTGVHAQLRWMARASTSLRVGGRFDAGPSGGALSPRVQLDGRLGPHLHWTVGSGVHREILLVPIAEGSGGAPGTRMARGVHHRAGVAASAGSATAYVSAFTKKVAELPGTAGVLRVRGLEAAGGAGIAHGAGLHLGLIAERRRGDQAPWWSWTGWTAVEWSLPSKVDLRVRAEAQRGGGGLYVAGVSADTLGLGGGGARTSIDGAPEPWSLGLDLELRRPLLDVGAGRTIRAYVQALNVLGTDLRPAFTTFSGESRADHLPRVLVFGIAMAPAPPLGSDVVTNRPIAR